MPEDPITHEHPVTPLGRTAQSFVRRRRPEFAVEFILIIAGILTALAIDATKEIRAAIEEELRKEQLRNPI